MKVYISQKPLVTDEAIVVSAVDGFVLVSRFTQAEDVVDVVTLEDGSVIDKTVKAAEDANAEQMVSALLEKGASDCLASFVGTKINGSRIGLPDVVWVLGAYQVLDFDYDKYGSGERSARSMWKFSFGNSNGVPVNAYSQTYFSKSPLRVAQRRYNADAILFLPFKATLPCDEDATLHLFAPNAGLVSFIALPEGSTVEQLTIAEVSKRKADGEVFPDLTISAPTTAYSSNGIEATVTCSWRNGGNVPDGEEVFIETSAGYVSKQRAKLVNGQAKFKFIPLGLESGDVAKIQVGFRLFTGLAEAEIEVA